MSSLSLLANVSVKNRIIHILIMDYNQKILTEPNKEQLLNLYSEMIKYLDDNDLYQSNDKNSHSDFITTGTEIKLVQAVKPAPIDELEKKMSEKFGEWASPIDDE